jgi:outer membrane receptor protein involved in Fe transport
MLKYFIDYSLSLLTKKHTSMRIKRILLIVFTAIMLPFMPFAQVTTSSMSGTITASNGEPLVGATITATHQPSGTVYNTLSRGGGQFTIANMRVGGPYQVVISYVGYQAQTVNDINLQLAEPYALNASLTGGTTLTEVTVTTTNRNSILNANRTGSTTNISTAQINRLPSVSRSINDLTRLTPQASSTATGAIGGGNYRQNYITVDGADFNNTFGIGTNLPAGGSPISLDALEEISINVTPYDVRQSGFIGSAINAVTRAGTNNFSGSAYTFWRTENQQGNKVAYNDPLVRQNLQVNTEGFRFGGPIIKNKLFFFINAEKGKTIQPGQTNIASTPGQFGAAGTPSNVVRPTVDSLNLIRKYLLEKYEYETGDYQGYSNISENTRYVARIDWNINTKNRFNVRYSQVESKSPSFVSTSRSPLQAFPSTRTSNNALPFKNANYFQDANFYSFSAELNSTVLRRFANTLRGTSTHQNDPRSSESAIFPFVDILSAGNPYTSFGYEPFTYGNLRDVKTLSFVDNLIWTSGKNTFTLGAQADFQSTKNGFQRFATSYYTFRSWEDFVAGVKPLDYAITYSLTPGYQQAFPRFKFAQYALYGQDEIAVTKNLRVTAGLRADLLTYLNVKEIQTHPLVANLTFADGEKINTGVLPKSKWMFSPRVGFNWDVKGDRSLQLRGGTGIFTGRVPTVWIVAQSGDAGLIQFTQVYETPTADRNNPARFVTPGPFNPDPRAYLPATAPAAGTSIPSSVSAIDPNFKFPQTWKSSLAVDIKLPFGIVGTLEGIYNKDLIVALGRNPNLVTPTPLNIKDSTGKLIYPDTRPIYPISNTQKFLNPLTSAGQPSATGTSAFNPVDLYNKHEGYYWSLMAKIDKQFSKGLFLSVAYVKSKAKVLFDGNGDQLLNTWSLTQIVNNSNDPELSYANYVVPDRVIATVSYRREYLKHLGTTVSLFFEGSISNRFSYTYSSDFNRDGQNNDLIYIPANASEISFADQTYGTGSTAVTYTARQQSDLFFRYIEQDKYLSAHKGQYAERNGAKYPWRNQVDVKFAQDIFASIGKKRNTLQFTLDIFNFGNMLNKSWGIFRTANVGATGALLVPRNVTNTANISLNVNGVATSVPAFTPTGTTKPYFSLVSDRNVPITSTFRDVNTISSTYYMQFGLRYIFGQ